MVMAMVVIAVVAMTGMMMLNMVAMTSTASLSSIDLADFQNLVAIINSSMQNEISCRTAIGGPVFWTPDPVNEPGTNPNYYPVGIQNPIFNPPITNLATALANSPYEIAVYYPTGPYFPTCTSAAVTCGVASLPNCCPSDFNKNHNPNPNISVNVGLGSSFGGLRNIHLFWTAVSQPDPINAPSTYSGTLEVRATVATGMMSGYVVSSKSIGYNIIYLTVKVSPHGTFPVSCTTMSFTDQNGNPSGLPVCGLGMTLQSVNGKATCVRLACQFSTGCPVLDAYGHLMVDSNGNAVCTAAPVENSLGTGLICPNR